MLCFNPGLTLLALSRKRTLQLAIGSSALALVLAACGGNGGDSVEPGEVSALEGTEPAVVADGSSEEGASASDVGNEAAALEPDETSASRSTSSEAVTVGPDGHLEEGGTGPRVEQLQRALAVLGFDPGPVDGTFGPQTKTAVGAFQRALGATPDGIVHEETAEAINRALGERG